MENQFVADFFGDMDLLEYAGENVDSADENQVMERSRVGDDDAHLFSKAESPQGGAFPIEVFASVIEPDLVSLEEAVEFIAGLQAEKLAQLRFGKAASLVFLQRKGFEGAAGEIIPRCGETLGDIVRDVEGEFHG